LRVFLAGLGVALMATPAVAQIDYRNLDHGRPGEIDDAYPVERYAFEAGSGFRMFRASGSEHLRLESGIAYGLFRGGHVALHAPVAWTFGSTTSETGLAGIDVSLLMNLGVERRGRR
jgi:hypothetical protein